MSKNKKVELDNQKTVKTAILNTVANGFSLIVGIIMIPVISRILSPEDLGIATTFISTRNTVVIVVTAAVYAYVYRAMLELKGEEEKKDYIFSLTIFCVCAVFVFYLLALPLKHYLMIFLSLDNVLYNWLFVSVLVFALFSIADYYCIYHNKSLIVFGIVLCTGTVSQLLSVALANFLREYEYWGRVFGLDAVYVIISMLLIIWLFISGKRKFCFHQIKHTLFFTIPIIPHLLSQMILTQCDLVMVSYFSGSDKGGLYSMGHTVGFLAFTIMSHLMAAWSPWVYRRLQGKDWTIIYSNSKLVMLLGMYMSMGLLTISPELVDLFLQSTYSGCKLLIPPLVLSMFFQFIYLFFYDLEYYYRKTRWIAFCSVVAALVNLILNFVFIPLYGYVAAGYTTMFSYLVLLLTNAIFSRRLNVYQIYPIKYMLIITVFMSTYTIFALIYNDERILRYIIFVIITVVLIIAYKSVLNQLLSNAWSKIQTKIKK